MQRAIFRGYGSVEGSLIVQEEGTDVSHRYMAGSSQSFERMNLSHFFIFIPKYLLFYHLVCRH